jgi:DNA-binding SARP family transcriptional activator/tetratricopeptide (TPR) repeat protein
MQSTAARIRLCGRLAVQLGGESREQLIRGRQGRMLLAFLVLNRRRPVPRDRLVDALWRQDAAPPSDSALSPVLSRLRRALDPAEIDGRAGIVLRLPEPVWVDVEAAESALARARAAGQPDERLREAREAADLLESGLLPGHDAEWLREARDAVERVRVEALEVAAGAARPLDLALAEELARRGVAASPFRESAWVALIETLRARGNLAEALQAYEEIRLRLRDELGTVPGSELLAVHRRLLAADEAPAATGETALNGTVPTRTRRIAAPQLVEREDELAAVGGALDRARSGRGGVVLFEGPAGIGKTRLLDELRRGAEHRELRVLKARAAVLEREFGFGVVRQLLEPVGEDQMDGAAAGARAVLTEQGIGDGTFSILNGLFRLVERLARERPLALCVDDLQWSDPASLRFTAYLARRIADMPAIIAATVRTGEPDADEALLAELAQEPTTVALSPRPLTPEATERLIAQTLGRRADREFSDACHQVTAGNPLLLGQLLSALSAQRVSPDAGSVDAVRDIGPRAVARTVALRMRRLPAPAGEVARAAAVLGEQAGLAHVAAMARTDEPTAARAVQSLTRAEILRDDESLGFVHPLIRDAVYAELPQPVRTLEHKRAARLLAELGASPERVAAQLLLTTPRADPWVVTRLREAAHLALRRGAPDAAMRLLERAQAEPPPPEQRAALAFDLGGSAAYLRGPAGVEPLRDAYAGLTDPDDRARAAIRLSHLLLFVRSPQEGVELADQAARELPAGHEDFRSSLRAVRLVGAAFGAIDPGEFATVDDVRRGPRGTGPGARALTAMTALAVALTCGPAAEASALAREAFSEGLAEFELSAPIALGIAAQILGEPSEGLDAIAEYSAYARRNGEVLSSIGADLWGGFAHLWAGDLRAAMDSLDRAREGERLWGTKLDAVMAYSAAWSGLVSLERGDPLEAVFETLHRVHADDPRPDGARFWLASLAELALAEGRADDALEITGRLEPTRPARTHPVWAPWRTLRARALAQLGESAQARELALEDLSLAREIGAPWVIGRGLRILSELGGPDRLDAAREAVDQLSGTSAQLELAKAQLALGEALAAAGDSSAARETLAAAAELGERCGAVGLTRRRRTSRDETAARGA